MMNIISARNPQWADAANTHIDLLATFYGIGEIPFSASASDSEAHGQALFNRAVAGDFGAISPYVAPVKSAAQVKDDLVKSVQSVLDAAARAHGYDNIVSACSYAAAPNVFQAESVKFLSWRADCWAHCYAVLADVTAGTRSIPTEAELIAELPALVLP